MDADFWTSTRVHSVKHQSGPAAPHFNSADEEDEVRAFFPCPFCYVEIELAVFCAHHEMFCRSSLCARAGGNHCCNSVGLRDD